MWHCAFIEECAIIRGLCNCDPDFYRVLLDLSSYEHKPNESDLAGHTVPLSVEIPYIGDELSFPISSPNAEQNDFGEALASSESVQSPKEGFGEQSHSPNIDSEDPNVSSSPNAKIGPDRRSSHALWFKMNEHYVKDPKAYDEALANIRRFEPFRREINKGNIVKNEQEEQDFWDFQRTVRAVSYSYAMELCPRNWTIDKCERYFAWRGHVNNLLKTITHLTCGDVVKRYTHYVSSCTSRLRNSTAPRKRCYKRSAKEREKHWRYERYDYKEQGRGHLR